NVTFFLLHSDPSPAPVTPPPPTAANNPGKRDPVLKPCAARGKEGHAIVMSQMTHNRLPPTPDDEPEERGRGERDIIYALRTAHQNQMQLIVLADQKANILIGLVAVMGTILFTKANVLAPLEEKFVIPFAGFLCLEVLTLVLALFVLLPTHIGRRKGKKSEEMANPLFFGGFTNFTEAEYVTFLTEQLTDDRAA